MNLFEAYDRFALGKPTLIYCMDQAHVRYVTSVMLYAEAVIASTGHRERAAIKDRFKAGRTRALCGMASLTTIVPSGVAKCLILTRPLHTAGLYEDLLHTVNERDCTVVDLAGNTLRHGFPGWFVGHVVSPVVPE